MPFFFFLFSNFFQLFSHHFSFIFLVITVNEKSEPKFAISQKPYYSIMLQKQIRNAKGSDFARKRNAIVAISIGLVGLNCHAGVVEKEFSFVFFFSTVRGVGASTDLVISPVSGVARNIHHWGHYKNKISDDSQLPTTSHRPMT